MDKENRIFRQASYLGKALLISTADGSIVATGEGQFDTTERKLHVHFDIPDIGEHGEVMAVLQTNAGYFSPLQIYSHTVIPFGHNTRVHSMDTFLHWPLSKPSNYILEVFPKLDLFIKTGYGEEKQIIDKDGKKVVVTKRAEWQELANAEHGKYTVKAFSTFGTSFNRGNVDDVIRVLPRLGFTVGTNDSGGFSIRDIHKLIQAFQFYWINSHDYKDGEITAIRLGEIQCFIVSPQLKAFASNVTQYREYVAVDDTLEIEYLAKLIHFLLNPDNKKNLSSASKVGPALSRVGAWRFKERHRTIDYQVIDLVFALQSLCEDIADDTIKQANNKTKAETQAGVTAVLEKIDEIKEDLPENVRNFYLQDPKSIYGFITRPTFMESVRVTFERLGIDMSEHQAVIKEIDKARRQIVHSEKYDGEFLVELFTHGTTTVEKDEQGRVKSMAFGIKTGSVDKLYDLLKIITRAYLDQYKD